MVMVLTFFLVCLGLVCLPPSLMSVFLLSAEIPRQLLQVRWVDEVMREWGERLRTKMGGGCDSVG